MKKEYFEGWYFKHITKDGAICFIPGICISKKEKYAFIQIIETYKHKTYDIKYPITSFKYSKKPFEVVIGNSKFSLDSIIIDIKEDNLKLKGTIYYDNITPLHKSIINPSVMGILEYFPFQCKHDILSLKHQVNGHLVYNNQNLVFNNDYGYIEKDKGTSFPNSYLWLQGNDNYNSVSLSLAEVRLNYFHFFGFFAVIFFNDKTYLLSSYKFGKIKEFIQDDDSYKIVLKQGKYKLIVIIYPDINQELKAPNKGMMTTKINESLSSKCLISFYKGNRLLNEFSLNNCGFEIHNIKKKGLIHPLSTRK